MNRRQFLGGLLSLPFWGSAKRSEATPVQSGSTPPREAVGLSKREIRRRLRRAYEEYEAHLKWGKTLGEHPLTAPKGDV